jgi:hypothetical protein
MVMVFSTRALSGCLFETCSGMIRRENGDEKTIKHFLGIMIFHNKHQFGDNKSYSRENHLVAKKQRFLQYASFRFLLQTANIAAARHQFHVVRLMLTWHLPWLRKGSSPNC